MQRLIVAATALALAVPAAVFAAGPGGITTTTITTPTHRVTYREANSNMEPTIHCAKPEQGCLARIADRIVVQEPIGTVARFDVVAFEATRGAIKGCGIGGVYVLRVIGLPGETWSERDGYVYIGGKKLNEPYIEPGERDSWSFQPRMIPDRNYIVMGDNRSGSCDSRTFGPVPKAYLIGKVVGVERHA